MEVRKKKLPMGIENFEKLRSEDFYYIDKTGLIRELLNNWEEVNLFTRPRRFGKTLNMGLPVIKSGAGSCSQNIIKNRGK